MRVWGCQHPVEDVPCGVLGGHLSSWDDLATVDHTEWSLVTPPCPACQGRKAFPRFWGQTQLFFNIILEGKKENQVFQGAAEDTGFREKQPGSFWSKAGGCGFIIHNLLNGDLESRKR